MAVAQSQTNQATLNSTPDYMSRESQMLDIKWSRYIKRDHIPHKKQIAFLVLPHLEALYGGAAYGGKSDVLLMGALQYFDVPNYSGIIFRQELTAANLSEAIESRCKEWLAPFLSTGEVTYKDHTFKSCEGGTLSFGYLKKMGSELRYDSAQFQFIAFDELTHFTEAQYTYLFSRLRYRGDGSDSMIPLRMRGGTNPGGPGHQFVRKRFQIEQDPDGEFRGKNKEIPFIQAKVDDNPSGNAQAYIRSLDKMSPLERERKKNGDWSASEEAQFKDYWFKSRWSRIKENFHLPDLRKDGSAANLRVFNCNQLLIFSTVDSACSELTGTEGRVFRPNQQPSWNACGIWGMTPEFDLLLLDAFHSQSHLPAFIHKIVELHRQWSPTLTRVESNTIGSAVCQLLMARGLNVQPVPAKTDKIMRSLEAQSRAEMGKVWLPTQGDPDCPWLVDYESELFTWTGRKHDVADQVDILSLAGLFVSQRAYGREDYDSLKKTAPMPYLPSQLNREHSGSSQGISRNSNLGNLASGGLVSQRPGMIARRSGRRQLLFRGL